MTQLSVIDATSAFFQRRKVLITLATELLEPVWLQEF